MKPTIALLLALFFISIAQADTIRLTNGTTLEGEILSEESDHYIALVKVTKTIRDQRKILKSEIEEIIAVQKDAVAFEAIQNLVPTPDLLGDAEYERKIEDVKAFMSEYPGSPLSTDASEILSTLESEQKVITGGGIKFDGKLIPASERQPKAYTLDSQIAAQKVKTEGDAGRRTSALRAWDEMESEFKNSKAYLDLRPYMVQLMENQLRKVHAHLNTLDERLKKRSNGLEQIPLKDRARAKQILEEENERYLKLIASEKEAGIQWISLNSYHKKPMDDITRRLQSEIRRLDRLDPSYLVDGDAVWEEAWTTLSGDPSNEEIRTVMTKVRSANFAPRYVEMLSEMLPEAN
ncbi:MAG: PTPDL family protein [Verrucomicrobiales bacterium]